MKKKKREKAEFDVQLAQRQMAALTIKSPVDGMVTVLPNFRAVMWGTAPPDFKEGFSKITVVRVKGAPSSPQADTSTAAE